MDKASITEPILEWTCLDAHPHKRGARWYAVGGLFIIGFAAYGIFTESWTTTLVAILMGAIYFITRNTAPGTQIVRIDGLGLIVAGNRYGWNELKDFWILLGHDFVELHFTKKSGILGELTVFIEEVDPAFVRETLIQFLPERDGMGERFLDYLTRILKL